MAKGKRVGQGLGQKDGTRVKGQWGGVGTWVKGGKGLGQEGARAWVRGILISPRNILKGIL